MHVKIDISADAENTLRQQWGDLDRAALEALLIESYRTGRVSVGFLAKVLEMGVIEADRWLAERGVPMNYGPEDFAADRRTIAELYPDAGR